MISPSESAISFEHGLEALFELAAVLRARDHRSDVERDHALVAQAFGHVALDDAAREPLDDGGLADAGLTDEHRVVLRAARQHLDDAADLFVAPDDRVDLALARGLGEVAAVLLERLILLFGVVARDSVRAAHLAQRVEHRVVRDAEAAQHVAHAPGHLGHREQHVLGRQVLVVERPRARCRRSRGLGRCSPHKLRVAHGRAAHARQLAELLVDGAAATAFTSTPMRSITPDTMPSGWSSNARSKCSGAISVLPASRAQRLRGGERLLGLAGEAVRIECHVRLPQRSDTETSDALRRGTSSRLYWRCAASTRSSISRRNASRRASMLGDASRARRPARSSSARTRCTPASDTPSFVSSWIRRSSAMSRSE